jgi:type I restriction enzyme S subunit
MEFRIVKLTDISKPKQWKNLPSSELTNEGYDVYGANGIIGKYTEYNHEYPTLAITCRGATCGNLHITNPKSYINSNAMALDNLSNDVNIKYLYYALNNRGFNDIITGSAQPQITREGLSNVKIPLPSLSEQIHLANILSKAETLIKQRKLSIDLLDEFLKSTFLEIFGDPVRNEKGWNKESFDNLVDSDCPLTYGIVQPGEEFTNGIPVIRPVDLTKTYIDRTGLKLIDPKISDKFKRTLLKGKEILMCVRGTTGVIALASKELVDCNVTRGIVPIWFSNNYNTFFAFGLLKTKSINNEIQSLTYGATLKQINLSDLRKIKLINPPIELQNQYGLIVEKVETLKKDYEASLKELENMYGVLSQKAFKGELKLDKVKTYPKIEYFETPVAGSLEPITEEQKLPEFSKKDILIQDMSLDDYYNIPDEIVAKYGSIEGHIEDWGFLLKKHFHDSPVDLNRFEEIYNRIYLTRGQDFEFERWKTFIFEELSTSKSYLKQKFNTETNQLELLINEIKKS